MDWNKAKNLIILFLAFLNIFLAVSVFLGRNSYTLSKEDEGIIRDVLTKNNISLYTEIIKNFKPMEDILMKSPEYDSRELTKAFFSEQELVNRTSEYNRTIFTDGLSKKLTIFGDTVMFRDNNVSTKRYTEDFDAISIANEFVESNSNLFPNFVLDKITTEENNVKLEFRQNYKNRQIFSNYLVLRLTNDGIIAADYCYISPEKFGNRKKQLLSPDKALFTLAQSLLNVKREKPVIITQMDIVYYQDELSDEKNLILRTEPYYRFYLESSKTPILINAYTGLREEPPHIYNLDI